MSQFPNCYLISVFSCCFLCIELKALIPYWYFKNFDAGLLLTPFVVNILQKRKVFSGLQPGQVYGDLMGRTTKHSGMILQSKTNLLMHAKC